MTIKLPANIEPAPDGWMPVTVSIALVEKLRPVMDVPGWVRTDDAPLAITRRPVYIAGADEIVVGDAYAITHRDTGRRITGRRALSWAEAEALHDALMVALGVDWARIDTSNPLALEIVHAALADAGIKLR